MTSTPAQDFEAERPRLVALATQMLGSTAEAEDAVQEAWIRLSRNHPGTIESLGAWLTTVTSRICLDLLRSRRARPAAPLDLVLEELSTDASDDPAATAETADSMGAALLVVLDTLAPVERLAFVLHDLFGMPFEEVAPIVGKSVLATRQVASRARRRVRGADPGVSGIQGAVGASAPVVARRARQREVVAAFLSAAKGGDLFALIDLLDPSAVARSDAAAVAMGGQPRFEGAEAVAGRFSGGAKVARLATIDGETGLIWSQGGVIRVVFSFTLDDSDRVVGIDMIADADRIATMDIEAG